MVGLEGFEPPTHGLGKPRRREQRFFRPWLGVRAHGADSKIPANSPLLERISSPTKWVLSPARTNKRQRSVAAGLGECDLGMPVSEKPTFHAESLKPSVTS
jgi:hypothetical protein